MGGNEQGTEHDENGRTLKMTSTFRNFSSYCVSLLLAIVTLFLLAALLSLTIGISHTPKFREDAQDMTVFGIILKLKIECDGFPEKQTATSPFQNPIIGIAVGLMLCVVGLVLGLLAIKLGGGLCVFFTAGSISLASFCILILTSNNVHKCAAKSAMEEPLLIRAARTCIVFAWVLMLFAALFLLLGIRSCEIWDDFKSYLKKRKEGKQRPVFRLESSVSVGSEDGV